MEKDTKVAIIGGGVSGVSVFVKLVEKANLPLSINLFEKTGSLGKGIAFGTKAFFHPLNVKACRMGIDPDKPDEFYQWLKKSESIWRNMDSSYHEIPLDPEAYYPRMIYSRYIQGRFNEATLLAEQKGISFVTHFLEIETIKLGDGRLELLAKEDQSFDADWAILATGIPPVKGFVFESEARLSELGYIKNIWGDPKTLFLKKDLQEINRRAVIIGSGLTAVDAVLSLEQAGFQGSIDVISRSGQFPFAHSKHHKQEWVIEKILPNESCLQLFRALRKEWSDFLLTGKDWREFVDALRPHTVALWKGLGITGKKQFLRLLFSNWNRLRHRMSPESGEIILNLFESFRLKKIAGTLTNVESNVKGKLLVAYLPRGDQAPRQTEADLVINCTGPQYLLSKRKDTLLKNLLEDGLVLSDPLGKGLKTDGKERLQGKTGGRLFALGAHLFGENLETVAVPEIRMQAASIVKDILASINSSNQVEGSF